MISGDDNNRQYPHPQPPRQTSASITTGYFPWLHPCSITVTIALFISSCKTRKIEWIYTTKQTTLSPTSGSHELAQLLPLPHLYTGGKASKLIASLTPWLQNPKLRIPHESSQPHTQLGNSSSPFPPPVKSQILLPPTTYLVCINYYIYTGSLLPL